MPEVTAPGFYPDFTEDQYHADPAPRPSMSSGIAATLIVGTPAQAKHKHPRLNPELELDDSTKYDLGNVAHELVLGRGPGIVPLDYGDWKKKEAQEARKALIEQGKQPCLLKVYEQAQAMHLALRVQLGDDPENSDAFTNGVGEEAAFWKAQTPLGQMWMRQLTDWRMTGRPAIYDYKTFAGERGADPEAFVKHIVGQGKDVQDPHYSRGLAAILGIPVEDVVFRFVVQDPKPPYNAVVVEFDAQTKEFAHKRWDYAVKKWAMCAASGIYPGFPARTHYVGAPGWAQVQFEQKLIAEEMAEEIERRDREEVAA